MKKQVLIPIISGSVLLVAAGVIIGIVATRPMVHYDKGVEFYNSNQYAQAITEFEAAGDYKNAAELLAIATKQQALVDGDQAMQAGDYALACEKYVLAADFDVGGTKLFEATKNNVYKTGQDHLAAGEYKEAAQCFSDPRFEFDDKGENLITCAEGMLDNEDYSGVQEILADYGPNSVQYSYLAYAKAMDAYNSGDNSTAQTMFEKAGFLRDSKDMLNKTTYSLAVEDFEDEKYFDALDNFSKLSLDYEDTKDYVKKCKFMKADFLLSSGDYVGAKEIFKNYDDDYEYNGILTSDRMAELDKYSDYFDLIEIWKCSYGNIDARQITGSAWTSWTLTDDKMDNKGDYASVNLTFTVLYDGSVSLQGTVTFRCLTEYSYVKSLLEFDEKKYTINETITSPSGTINLDDNTTLKFSKDSLTLKFSKTDQVTAYTKEVCSAEYKFEH